MKLKNLKMNFLEFLLKIPQSVYSDMLTTILLLVGYPLKKKINTKIIKFTSLK